MTLRPTVWSTLSTFAVLIVLLLLGTWQLNRLAWKEDVIERLESRLSATPIMLPTASLDPEQFEFRRVSVTGEFLHDLEFFLLNRVRNGVVGGHIITPLRRMEDTRLILVDRGWVPFDRRDPASRPEGQVSGVITIDAIVRTTPDRGWFVPGNRSAMNEWYFMDPAAMARSAGIVVPEKYYLAVVEYATPGDYPVGRGAQLFIRNDHLGYAITWYALAVVLLIVYAAHAWKRR